MTTILMILGALLVLEGIPYFAFPVRARRWAMMVQEVPEKTLRIMGFIAMLSGLVILFVVRFA
ncbi:MAG: DUF2065 domain-containing protein [Deltaproteobacteria bacterium]